jgi:hypothetical protein
LWARSQVESDAASVKSGRPLMRKFPSWLLCQGYSLHALLHYLYCKHQKDICCRLEILPTATKRFIHIFYTFWCVVRPSLIHMPTVGLLIQASIQSPWCFVLSNTPINLLCTPYTKCITWKHNG